MAAALSSDLKSFLDENISSQEDLQVLLLMHENAARTWDAVDVARRLGIDPFQASRHLIHLHHKGLVEQKARRGAFSDFQYVAQTEDRQKKISTLAAAFGKAKTDVVDYIFESNRGQLKSLAAAFQFKKD